MPIARVSPREAFNRVVAESVLLIDCCVTPAELVPGAVAVNPELSPVDVAVRAAYDWAMEEFGPEDPYFAVVFDDSSAGEGVRGREVAEWLRHIAGCKQVWMVDREAFAREYGFVMGADLDEVQAHPQEITDSVFLGSVLAVAPNVLHNLGITHVVSVMDRDAPPVGERPHIHCRVPDSTEIDLGPTFDEALPFIEAALSSSGRVLVHCEQGRSRSASVVIAHILKTMPGMSAEEALDLVKSQRPLARPNAGFMGQLQQRTVPKRVLLMRHGQSTANVTHDHDTPDPFLSAQGEVEAAAWCSHIAALRVEVVLVSPLRRAVQTACLAFAQESTPMELCRCAKEVWVDEPECTPSSEAILMQSLREWPRGSEMRNVHREMQPHEDDLRASANILRLTQTLIERPEAATLVVCHSGVMQRMCLQKVRHPRNSEVYECELTSAGLRFVRSYFPGELPDESLA